MQGWYVCHKCKISAPWSKRHYLNGDRHKTICEDCFLQIGAEKFVKTLGRAIKKLAQE